MAFRTLLAAAVATALALPALAQDPVKVGYIGSMSSDTGLSTLRGATIAIEELNAAGGVLGGRPIELVTADTGEDVAEGIRAYEYLAETEEVDFIVSGSIDDVSLGWLPRMTEYRIPTLDTWTSFIGIIDLLVEDYETHKMYFMNIASDEALATLYVNFGRDVLAEQMGWDQVVILQEDTAFGNAINGLVSEALAPFAGIEVVETIVYDIATNDFAPIFSRAQESGADFIYIISSVNSQVVSSQYVKLQVPMAMTGVNVGALGQEYWDDTGGAGGGISTLSPVPSVGFALDPASEAFVEKYQAAYGDSRPVFPH
ncbi:MAG: ABC transporter substrate-binding protein, partial [Pseudomonadota bacterium]